MNEITSSRDWSNMAPWKSLLGRQQFAWCPARVFIPQAAVSVQDLGQSLFYPCSPTPFLLLFVCVRSWMLIFPWDYCVQGAKGINISSHIPCTALNSPICYSCEILHPRSRKDRFVSRPFPANRLPRLHGKFQQALFCHVPSNSQTLSEACYLLAQFLLL